MLHIANLIYVKTYLKLIIITFNDVNSLCPIKSFLVHTGNTF